MEAAAQSAVLQPAERQIGAAVRAAAVDQAEFTAVVAEQDQVPAHDLGRHQRSFAVEFLAEGDGRQ